MEGYRLHCWSKEQVDTAAGTYIIGKPGEGVGVPERTWRQVQEVNINNFEGINLTLLQRGYPKVSIVGDFGQRSHCINIV
jgi:hypothetical protein